MPPERGVVESDLDGPVGRVIAGTGRIRTEVREDVSPTCEPEVTLAPSTGWSMVAPNSRPLAGMGVATIATLDACAPSCPNA